MKKLGILTLFVAMLFTSCSTSKVANQTEKTFKGDWTLNEITTSEGNMVDVKNLFDHASMSCFEGSIWHMVANNSTGWYQLNGATCPEGQSNIKWYMEEDGSDVYFWFKRIGVDQKAKNVKKGYKMKVVLMSETEARLMHEVPFEDGKMEIYYHFNKQ